MRLVVPPGVFRPPPDARLLAEAVRERAPGADVLDVCTGSGFLAVGAALAGARSVTATDVSRRAILTTRINGALNGVRVRVRRGDLLAPAAGQRFDLIVSNPPYLPAATDALPAHGLARATEAGRDGRALLDRLLADAPRHLRPDGTLLVVHSSLNDPDRSLDTLRRAGLRTHVERSERGPLGPMLTARAGLLEERGLLAPGERDEDVVVIAAQSSAA